MNIFINDNVFKCKVCVTPQSIIEGMQNKTFNMNFNGMFFMMPNKMDQSFWMYECIVPLDIIFIESDTITKIHHNCQPCDDELNCDNYTGFGDRILEVDGGTCHQLNIKEGDTIKTSIY
jgi:uncharacterized membrane protein (UPF0127 family)